MIRITLTEHAAQDLEDIYEYIARDNIAAADNHRARLRQRWEALIEQPRMGRQHDELRTGYRSVTEGDYVILYRLVSESELEIVRVVHGKRDLGKALKESDD